MVNVLTNSMNRSHVFYKVIEIYNYLGPSFNEISTAEASSCEPVPWLLWPSQQANISTLIPNLVLQ